LPVSFDKSQEVNTITTQLLYQITGCDQSILELEAKSSNCYIKLDWTFPRYSYPLFTTRHRLVRGDKPCVTFNSDLTWARNILQTSTTLGLAVKESIPSPMSTSTSPTLLMQTKPGATMRLGPASSEIQPVVVRTDMSNMSSLEAGSVQQLPHDYTCMASEITQLMSSSTSASDEETYSTPPSEAGDYWEKIHSTSHSNMGQENSLNTSAWYFTNAYCDSRSLDHTWDSQSSKCLIESIRGQRVEASELFCRNGDTSGLLAVLSEASNGSAELWHHPSGLPNF
jgi:hypothetical protein